MKSTMKRLKIQLLLATIVIFQLTLGQVIFPMLNIYAQEEDNAEVSTAQEPIIQTTGESVGNLIHNIEVCFITLDRNSNVLQSLPSETIMQLDLYDEGVNLLENQINTYGVNPRTITYSNQTLNRDLLYNDGIYDGYCSTQQYIDPVDHEYAYTQVSLLSPNNWASTQYNDQFNVTVANLTDFFEYSNEFFDDIIGNEAQRDINADGHIVMSNGERVYRHLIIKNQLLDDLSEGVVVPEIAINIEQGGEYTANSLIDPNLEFILGSRNDTSAIRFGSSIEDTTTQNWFAFSEYTDSLLLPDASEDGQKQLCVQVNNAAGESNIACDTIMLDTSAPIGEIYINNDALQSPSTNLTLSLSAEDPLLTDTNAGSGIASMRFSENNSEWSEWESYNATKELSVETLNAEVSVNVQYKDAVGNISEVYSDTIYINLLASTGQIIINNDDLFTDNVEATIIINASNVKLMRFVQTTDSTVPSTPPPVFDPSDNLGGWTYWYQYQPTNGAHTMQWNLSEPEAGEAIAEFGQKNIYVQFMYNNNSVSPLYKDSIIYAPYYGIEYYSVEQPINNPQEPEEGTDYELILPKYTLTNVPSVFMSYDQFELVFNAKNTGSLSWMYENTDENEPIVNLTYYWEAIEVDPLYENLVQELQRGNNAEYTSPIHYNQETGEVKLLVYTPSYPGTYKLILDCVNESVAKFSDFNNPSPTFDITVEQNPNTPPPLVYVEIPIPDNAGYYPSNPQAGQRHVIRGIIEYAPANQWGATYWLRETDGSGAYWYIIQYDIGQYLGQTISIPIEFKYNGSYEFYIIGWDSQVVSYPSETLYLRPGGLVEVEVRYRNDGYHYWPTGTTRLGSQQPQDRNSKFYDSSTWISPGRIDMKNTSSIRFGDVARFRFKFKAPSTIADGSYRECFRPLVEGVSWAGGSVRDVCMNIVIDSNPSNPIPSPIFTLPPEPTGDTGYVIRYDGVDLLTGPHTGFPVLDHLNYEEEVKVLGQVVFNEFNAWLKVRTLDGQEGFVPRGSIDYADTPPTIDYNIGLLFDNVYVCSSGVSARSGPGNQFPTVGYLPYGFSTKILVNYEGWNLIILTNGATGWVQNGLCNGLPSNSGGGGENSGGTGSGGSVLGSTIFNNQIFSRPLNDGSYTISQGYSNSHQATDYAAACGTPVFASADGYVYWVVSGFNSGYYENPPQMPVFYPGMSVTDFQLQVLEYKQKLSQWQQTREYWYQRANFIVINHDNNSQSLYVHLKDVMVTSGQRVKRGQQIGTVGNTGWSSGCHLHLEIRADQNNPYNTKIDPERIFQQGINGDALAAEVAILSREGAANYRLVNNNNKFVHEYCGAWIKDYEYFLESGQTWRTYTNIIYNPKTANAYRVRGDVRIAYWDKYNGPCGKLGSPTSDDLWAATSPNGTTGAYQSFDGGVIHSSNKGTYASWGSIHQQHTAQGGSRTYGFPTSEIYSTADRGLCQNFETEVVCEKATVDNRSEAGRAIDLRASKLKSTQASALTQICGYPAKLYSQVIPNEDGAIAYVNGKAVYSYGGTYDTFNYYSDKCDRFGIFVNDPKVADKGMFNTPGAYQDFQKLASTQPEDNGRIYWSWKHQGKFVFGTIWQKYEAAYGTKSNYGWPTSEVYSYTIYAGTPDEFTTTCQSFEGSEPFNRICEDTIPSKSEAQKALEARLGIDIAPSELYIACGGRTFVNIPNGIAYYDPIYKNTRLIINPVHPKWSSEGGCDVYGLPENDTESVWSITGNTGFAQRFNKEILTFDFYSSEFGLFVLEGTARNLYEAAGGLGNTGFPKRVYTDDSIASRGICVQTEQDTLCENQPPDWYTVIQNRLNEINHPFDENLFQDNICTDVAYKTYPLTNPTGVMYYDSMYNNVRIIRGEIYTKWNSDGRCGVYGLPENDTDFNATSYTNIVGQAQRYHRDTIISDFYNSEFGLFILEGVTRNLYEAAGGLGVTGFPKSTYVDEVRGKCVDTEKGLLCEKDEPEEPEECDEGYIWDGEECVGNLDNTIPLDVVTTKGYYSESENPTFQVRAEGYTKYYIHISNDISAFDNEIKKNVLYKYWEQERSTESPLEFSVNDLRLWFGEGEDRTIYYRADGTEGAIRRTTDIKSFTIKTRTTNIDMATEDDTLNDDQVNALKGIGLPFNTGENWYVCQGYNPPLGWSHYDTEKFKYALDLVKDNSFYSTAGYELRAPMNGTVEGPYDAPGGKGIRINNGDVSIQLDHLADDSLLISRGAEVIKGEIIGRITFADPSVLGGCSHLHINLSLSNSTPIPLTYGIWTVPFTNGSNEYKDSWIIF